ncbi:MAG: preprotein translocase subunit SecE [Gammaproteobacteria bacterium]|nr:preprotein translocase subunit SecE [Gammaproteobacteria bacterium]
MSLRIENQNETKLDWLKWLFIGVLLVAGIAANYYYNQQPWPLRLLAWLFLLAIIASVAAMTQKGKQAISFARESRMELRKVVWPTRQETVQTTLMIAVMVLVLSIILWALDGVLVWLIGWLTGQRG